MGKVYPSFLMMSPSNHVGPILRGGTIRPAVTNFSVDFNYPMSEAF